jgi:UDP-N-acetylmuramoylalanine--D-glutamate ligase
VKRARELNIDVVNEIELAASHLPDCHFIGITGTNGKSTTTTILGSIVTQYDPNTFVGGNLGTPLCEALAQGQHPHHAVLELSSYQLELITTLKLDAAVLTNLAPDHLDRYASVDDYYRAKMRIFDLLKPGGVRVVADENHGFKLNPTYYRGQHNRENAAAAIAAARVWHIPDHLIQRGLDAYTGLAHRLQWLGEARGVQWVNDSKATNVDSAIVAIKSFDKNVHLIVGGIGKGSSYAPLVDACKGRVKAVYVIGQDAPNLLSAFSSFDVTHSRTLEQAVSDAKGKATAGDIILLAPACASFDQFENYAKRGDRFISLFEEAS